jgi:pyruvate dehydrogenase E2 component (dihydrolipoamide acetyltransferase)
VATTSIDILMPRLSDSMVEGTIARWLKGDGEQVRRGEEIVEIDTDKTTMAFEADADGTLRILAGEGETLSVGAPIALIEGAVTASVAARSAAGASAPNASPLARQLADQLGVDLAAVTGTGPEGRILKEDVRAARTDTPAVAPAVAVGAATSAPAGRPLTRLERIVSRRMAEAALIPTFVVESEVGFDAVLALRQHLADQTTPAPSLNDVVVKAVALALGQHPRLNSSFVNDTIVTHASVDVAIAIAAGDDLFVPVIEGADQLSLSELASRSRELVARSRAGELTRQDLAAGTFTVTNLGMLGVTRFTPLINPPNAAILSVGALRPVHDAAHETVASLSLVADHRVVYGAHAAAFLATVRELLEHAERLAP